MGLIIIELGLLLVYHPVLGIIANCIYKKLVILLNYMLFPIKCILDHYLKFIGF